MSTNPIDEQVVAGINQGKEADFAALYTKYFTYLCTYATSYIFNPGEAEEIVNDIFVSIWKNKENLTFPVHSFLLRSVRNRCLNYIRSLRTRERVIDEYFEELIRYQEEYCLNTDTPLQLFEIAELQLQVQKGISALPEKCRIIFEHYIYNNKTPQEIADELGLSINTVRVQIKNAMDKLKQRFGSFITILLLFLLKE